MRRRILIVLLCLTMGLSGGALAAPFADVAAGSWYEDAVNEVVKRGIMNGSSATAFSPNAHVTRGMVATVLWRLAGSPKPKQAPPFPDLQRWYYYADAAAWAGEVGIATGYGDGRFGGGDTVTREQLALFLYRYAKFSGGETASGILTLYPDADQVDPWAKAGMAHAVGTGLITGRDNGTLDPLGSATRAQLAVILQRLMIPAVG